MGHASNDTKQRLSDTALDLIWKSSYGSVSVDDICKEANVKKGSFYHFFPSKVDLAVAAMEQTSTLMKPGYDRVFSAGRAFSAGLEPAERFARYADLVYQNQIDAQRKYGRVCGCPCAALGSELAGQEEGVCSKFADVTENLKRYFKSALRDMAAAGDLPAKTDIEAKADEVYAYVMGQLVLARIQNDLGPLKKNLKQGLFQLLGIKASGAKAA
jgi:TetR/AcrR family transcriptional repressor of nem operon